MRVTLMRRSECSDDDWFIRVAREGFAAGFRGGNASDTGRFTFFDMTRTGIRKVHRLIASTALTALAVAGSIAFAGPRAEWLSPADNNDTAGAGQSNHFTTVSAKDGLTPVSAEVRPVPRAEQATPFRGAGSIRADIARYNEERSSPRPVGRPSDDARSPVNANYRN
jgi:hypothetical protein